VSKQNLTMFQAITLILTTTGVVVTAMEYLKEAPPIKSEIVLQNFNAIELIGDGVVEFVATQGTDEQGKSAKMVVSVLSKEFNWSMGSTNTVELLGKKIDYLEYIGSDSFVQAFNECEDIVVLGMASKEGNQISEERRAYKRGLQLGVWLRQLINPKPAIYLLNIGQYRGERGIDSSFQRRIVLICIFEKDESVDIRSALYASLLGNQAFNFPLKQYSLFGDITNLEQLR
jgi:hypothetical protein